jgi:2-hydroxychromene-2-carboxylate isomerase
MTVKAQLYLDVISPFSYLYIKQLHALSGDLDATWVPVLFAGLLKHWNAKGPAELPTKRTHTYQWCTWRASRLGIPFRMPPRHPFNPLQTLRLLIALGSSRDAFCQAFDFVYAEGRDPEREWPLLCERFGLSTADAEARIAQPEIKAALVSNTEAAIAQGVFGVPTLALEGHIFWGGESMEWANDYLRDPRAFDSPEMHHAANVEFGVARKA